jgi:hypothetical protein
VRTPTSLPIFAALVCAGCSNQSVVDGTADLVFRLGAPPQIVHERRPAIAAYQGDEGGSTFVTLVDDAGSDPCSLSADEGGQIGLPAVCTLATPLGRAAVTLTGGHVPRDDSELLTIEGTLADGAGSMTLSFSGTPR